MAKFNNSRKYQDLKPDKNTMLNHEGSTVHSLNALERLFSKVLASMFGEKTYYSNRNAESDFKRLIEDVDQLSEEDKEYALKIALLGRKHNMITYPLELLTVCFNTEKYKGDKFLSKYGKNKLQYYSNGMVLRAKDITEILLAQFNMYQDRPIPIQMRKALKYKLEVFDKYKLSKGLGKNNEVSLADAIKLLRPKPENIEMEKVYKDIIEGNLKFGGGKKQIQSELVKKGQGRSSKKDLKESIKHSTLQALIQNLVALNRQGLLGDKEIVDVIVSKLENPKEVEKSKLLPYKFYSAYKSICSLKGIGAKRISDAIVLAIDNSIKNLPELKGYNAILVDISGSMEWTINSKSVVTAKDNALLLGAIAYKLGNSDLYLFANRCEKVVGISKHSTIVDIVDKLYQIYLGGGTNLSIALNTIDMTGIKYDNLIILSDNDCYGYNEYTNSISFGSGWSRSSNADEQINSMMKRRKIKKVWINNLLGNDFAIVNTENHRKNLVSGFSEKFVEIINSYEELSTGDIRLVIDKLLKGESL